MPGEPGRISFMPMRTVEGLNALDVELASERQPELWELPLNQKEIGEYLGLSRPRVTQLLAGYSGCAIPGKGVRLYHLSFVDRRARAVLGDEPLLPRESVIEGLGVSRGRYRELLARGYICEISWGRLRLSPYGWFRNFIRFGMPERGDV